MRADLELNVRDENWRNAAHAVNSLSELELLLGNVTSAVREGEQSVVFADRFKYPFERMTTRTTLAEALYQAGEVATARARLAEAETLQRERQPGYPILYSVSGFRFCDLLLADVECRAWQATVKTPRQHSFNRDVAPGEETPSAEALNVARQRTTATLLISERNSWLLDIALDHLTLGRVALWAEILECAPDTGSLEHLDRAVYGIREGGDINFLPRALLSRAWLMTLRGRITEARANLGEAEQIAERGPMPLFLADIHLYRARLFFREEPEAAKEHLAKARELIFKHGYLRRKEELEDAERVILA